MGPSWLSTEDMYVCFFIVVILFYKDMEVRTQEAK